MNDKGADDKPEEGAGGGFQSKRARQLFGHQSGGNPWEEAAKGARNAGQPAPEQPQQASSPRESEAPLPTSSAPYPKHASYAAPEVSEEPAPNPIITDVDDEVELTKLHPNYKLLMRVGAVITSVVLMVAALAAEGVLSPEIGLPPGVFAVPALLLALFLIIRLPAARFNARGYQISRDRLRVVRGIMFHSDTIVPFGRVQHIDVDQGPIERALDIATMTLHTAGNHNASVSLPGLGHELAVQMREEIRAHIKRESM